MRTATVVSRQRGVIVALAAVLFALPGLATARAPGPVVADFEGEALTSADIEFQRGVFRVDPVGNRVTILCIPVDGIWRQPGKLTSCGADPPESMRREAERYTPDKTVMTVRNLGITRAEWDASGTVAGDDIRAIHKAFSYAVEPQAVRWRFDTRPLPAMLRTQIPGSGIHVHFGGDFSAARKPLLFEPGQGDLQVETRLSIPRSTRTGKAHSGVTLGIVVQAPTTADVWVGIPIIASVFNRELAKRENIRSDGRVNFVLTYFGAGTRYVTSVAGAQKTDSWNGFETFAFQISRENLRNIVVELNKKRGSAALPKIDESALDKTRVAGMSLRNESRFLDEGNIDIEVIVDYVRALRAAPDVRSDSSAPRRTSSK
ncbi:MAG: hypothetical protein IPG91_18665 [Ideonella sp.]|nr:hypothetical protein [Ideonella sp.]